VGERLATGVDVPDETPLPLSVTFWGLPVALSVMVTLPVRVPVAVGLKFTLIVQRIPVARDVPQAPSPARAKSPLTVTLLIVKVALPLLVSVENCAALVVPTV